jgi:hypothetical protein
MCWDMADGQTLPLMNIVFGNLVSSFSAASVPGVDISPALLQSEINKNTLVFRYFTTNIADILQALYCILVYWQVCACVYFDGKHLIRSRSQRILMHLVFIPLCWNTPLSLN